MFTEKTRVEMDVTPGEAYTDSINLINTSQEPMDVKVYWEDFMYIEPYDGKKEFGPVGSSPYSMADWMAFSPQQFSLPAGGTQKIDFSIRVPSDAKGGHYGVLFYERNPQNSKDQTGLQIVTRLGTLFFVESTDKNKSATIDTISATAQGLEGHFNNNGDVVLMPKATFYALNQESITADRGNISRLYVPPGKTATFHVDFAESLPEGEYTAVLTFDLKGGDSLVKEVDFRKSNGSAFSILNVRD
jgi:hypothetical protein